MVGISLGNTDKSEDREQLVEKLNTDVLLTVIPEKGNEVVAPALIDVRRKQPSILFGSLSVLFMLGCLVIGTWLLFDFISRGDPTWHRTCRFRVKPQENDPDNRILFDYGGLNAFDDGKNQLLPGPTSQNNPLEFHQEVNVNLKKNTETIEVPQIGLTGSVRIVQDFDYNITGIRDFSVNRCFIMPLDRQNIPDPTNLIGTLLSIMSGQFLPDNEVLHKTMKVQTPALTQDKITMYGPLVRDMCTMDVKTYLLVPKTEEELKNRRRRSPNGLSFMYSVGQRAFMVDIDH